METIAVDSTEYIDIDNGFSVFRLPIRPPEEQVANSDSYSAQIQWIAFEKTILRSASSPASCDFSEAQ